MRNISFSLTEQQFLDGTKDITRRLGWLNLHAGEHLMACRKCMGLRPGEKIVRLGEIVVISVRREPLNRMSADAEYGRAEAIREGFPTLSGGQFVEMFNLHMKSSVNTIITRIEFKRVGNAQVKRRDSPNPPASNGATCSGSRLSADGRRRVSASMKRNWREGRIKPKPRAEYEKMWRKSNDVTRGTHGFGRQARGRHDHGRALVWTVKSPDGETWTIANLREWCRQNEDMFPSYVGAITPTWKRASDGLMTAYRRNETWYGWSILSRDKNHQPAATHKKTNP